MRPAGDFFTGLEADFKGFRHPGIESMNESLSSMGLWCFMACTMGILSIESISRWSQLNSAQDILFFFFFTVHSFFPPHPPTHPNLFHEAEEKNPKKTRKKTRKKREQEIHTRNEPQW
jgi:hypothetical protein